MHLADLHLGAPFKWMGAQASERSRDVHRAFAKAIDYALEHADLVLFAGDIFDHHHPPEEIVALFRSQIQRLSTAGIPAIAVPGNHDGYYYSDSVWRTHEFPGLTLITAPKIETPLSLEIKGIPVHIHGMAYQPTLSKPPFDTFTKSPAPGIHIAVIHGSLMNSPEWGIHARDIPLDPKNLANSGMNYVALGHYHRFARMDVAGIPIVYPGTIEGLDWQEDGDRFFAMVTFEDGTCRGVQLNAPTIQPHPSQIRTLHHVTIDITAWEESSTELLLKHILAILTAPQDLYRITITGTAQELIDLKAVEEEAKSHCFFAQFNDFTNLLEAKTIEGIAAEPTIRGSFVRAVRKRLDDPACDRDIVEMALRFGLEQFAQGEK
jgi:DNA repair exonuclease SbcCD nuclease subunit